MKNLNKITINMISKLTAFSFIVMIFTACDDEENYLSPNSKAPDNIQYVMAESGNAAVAPGEMSIAEVAINNDFNELVAALSYVDEELDAGLVDLFLNGKDQYTVFAPTDEAFQNLYTSLGIKNILIYLQNWY
ncbi:MAG: fasciclin domain-containing protein [Fulvivirga sp.]|nr:fasciclin domain-containing protein [Fulvivirga sp.]